MPNDPRPGRRGRYIDFPQELHDAFEAFARGQGHTFTAEVAEAMRRHLAYPPPPPAPITPLPDSPAVKKRGKGVQP